MVTGLVTGRLKNGACRIIIADHTPCRTSSRTVTSHTHAVTHTHTHGGLMSRGRYTNSTRREQYAGNDLIPRAEKGAWPGGWWFQRPTIT